MAADTTPPLKAIVLNNLPARNAVFEWDDATWKDNLIFYAGPPGSGVAFHNHTHAVNALVHGCKLTLLSPPDMPSATRPSPADSGSGSELPGTSGLEIDGLDNGGLGLDVVDWLEAVIACGRDVNIKRNEADLSSSAGASQASRNSPCPRRQVFTALQGPGDVLFIPTGWSHATVNLLESVGVAIELGDTQVMTELRQMMRTKPVHATPSNDDEL